MSDYEWDSAQYGVPELPPEPSPPAPTPLERAYSTLTKLAETLSSPPYHYVIHPKEETVSEFNQEIQAAKAKLAKATEKSARAQARVKEAQRVLREAEAKRVPKEPTDRASLGLGFPIHPVVTFQKQLGGKLCTYAAIGIPSPVARVARRWFLTGRTGREYTWDALLEFMGEEGRRTLAVTDASSWWHRPEFPA